MWPLEVIIAMNEKAHQEYEAKKRLEERQKAGITLTMAEMADKTVPIAKKVATA